MRISDWSSDVCSSDLRNPAVLRLAFDRIVARCRVRFGHPGGGQHAIGFPAAGLLKIIDDAARPLFTERLVKLLTSRGIGVADDQQRSEEHTSELKSLMRI